jgi:hypothetical protein
MTFITDCQNPEGGDVEKNKGLENCEVVEFEI